uniref:Uncharacterized protein n=1 Tax=Prolemur simus TaxID=1328070 RepID=A0A8C9AY85_PROSS
MLHVAVEVAHSQTPGGAIQVVGGWHFPSCGSPTCLPCRCEPGLPGRAQGARCILLFPSSVSFGL